MRVALFGGSFNPPHVGHQLAALWVLETQPVDALWFVPCARHAFDKPLAPFADRVRMCELAVASLGPRARVEPIEATLAGPSRTLVTVEALAARDPVARFSLVVGSDLVPELPTWHRAQELLARVPCIVVPRAGAGADPGAFAIPRISSTEVRARLLAGRPVGDLVPARILAYVAERGLYREPDDHEGAP